MPNWITNIIRSSTQVVHALLTEEGVDFNRIIPMPDNVIQGSVGHAAIDGVYQEVYYPPGTEDDPMGLKSKPLPIPEGAVTWYDWSIENWGCKWNAMESEVAESQDVVKFDTPWSHPWPVMDKLAEMFPETDISVAYADEDLGQNLGVYKALGELRWGLEIPFGSEAAKNLAAMIKYGVSYAQLNEAYDDDQRITAKQLFNIADLGALSR